MGAIQKKLLVLLIITAATVAVIAPIRNSMLDALTVALVIMPIGLLWIMFSHKLMRGLVAVLTWLMVGFSWLTVAAYLTRNSVGERLADAATALVVIYALIPFILRFREWLAKRNHHRSDGVQ